MEDDPNWGDFQDLLKNAYVTNPDTGAREMDRLTFINGMLGLVITNITGGYNAKDPTWLKSLGLSSMSKLIGGVMKNLPLQDYLEEMKELEKGL